MPDFNYLLTFPWSSEHEYQALVDWREVSDTPSLKFKQPASFNALHNGVIMTCLQILLG